MNINTTRLAVFAVAILTPASAFAHPGGHDEFAGHLVEHMLTSPFHMGALATGAVVLSAFVWKRVSKR